MKRTMLILLILAMAGAVVCGVLSRQEAQQPATPTPTAEPTATATPTAEPTATATPTDLPPADPAPVTVTDLEVVGTAARNHII